MAYKILLSLCTEMKNERTSEIRRVYDFRGWLETFNFTKRLVRLLTNAGNTVSYPLFNC